MLKSVPLFGNGIASSSLVVTAQRRLNCYFEKRPDGDKTGMAVFGTPGMTKFATLSTPTKSPVRGMLGWEQNLYAVSGNTFLKISASGTTLYSSSIIATANGPVSIANNNATVIVVDGDQGFLFANGVFSVIAAAGFPHGAKTVTFINGFFICELPGTGQFYVSAVYDGTTWDPLSFTTAAQYPDNIVAVDDINGILVTFSETHVEFWQNVGASPEPFAPILAAVPAYGLAAVFSRSHVGDTLAFLAQSKDGGFQVGALDGFKVEIISTPDLDSIINNFNTVSDATSLSYLINGHPMYQITFPTEGRSFLYDFREKLWSETQTGVSPSYARHTGEFSTLFQTQTIISDYANNLLYTVDPNNYTDNGTTIVRELVTRHATNDFNEFHVAEMYLDMETGVGLQKGQGSDPQISVQISKDGGRTWLLERLTSMGKVGKYNTRVIWRRFGSARDFTARFRVTDPVKFVIAKGAMNAGMGPQ